MSRLNEHTRMDFLAQSLLSEMKGTVEAKIVDGLVEDFKKRATALVKEELENVTIEHVRRAMNMLQMREELEIKINFGGANVVKRTL